MLDRAVSDAEKAAFLTALARRGETAAELAGFAQAYLSLARDPQISGSWEGRPLLDCCGTGGGGLNLLNISTGMMFILGAQGVPVVKHGNRGMTKSVGSGDVLEALGFQLDLPPERVRKCLEEVGVAFLFAPEYHPAFAVIAPVRRALAAQGQRTIFNLLGPLLNPARPESRLVGVFKPEHVQLYQEALKEMGCRRFMIVCGQDAESGKFLGEASAYGETIWSASDQLHLDGQKKLSVTWPDQIPDQKINDLLVQNAAKATERLENILTGKEKGLGRDLLIFNAGLALWVQGSASTAEDGWKLSKEAIDSGAAARVLQKAREFFKHLTP